VNAGFRAPARDMASAEEDGEEAPDAELEGIAV